MAKSRIATSDEVSSQLNGLMAVRSLSNYSNPFALQDGLHTLTHEQVVIGEENPDRHLTSPAGSRCATPFPARAGVDLQRAIQSVESSSACGPAKGWPRRRIPMGHAFRWCSAKAAPCGSRHLATQSPPGTSCGPVSTWPPRAAPHRPRARCRRRVRRGASWAARPCRAAWSTRAKVKPPLPNMRYRPSAPRSSVRVTAQPKSAP